MELQSAIVAELAKDLIETVRALDPGWSRVFFRFCKTEDHYGSNASYTSGVYTILFDPFKEQQFLESMNAKSFRLVELIGKTQAVILLTADSSFQYKVQFEYEDLERWKISKLNGGTGIPAGFDPAAPAR